jgi:hypothetical protein
MEGGRRRGLHDAGENSTMVAVVQKIVKGDGPDTVCTVTSTDRLGR